MKVTIDVLSSVVLNALVLTFYRHQASKEGNKQKAGHHVSEFVIHDLNQICDLLVLCCLNEPLSEIALDGNVEHFLLFTREASCLNFLLDFEELCVA